MKDKKLIEAFVQECIEEQEWKQRFKDNHIQMEDFFKYSGKTEPTSPLIEHYKYNENRRVDVIESYFNKLKTKKNGKNNKTND